MASVGTRVQRNRFGSAPAMIDKNFERTPTTGGNDAEIVDRCDGVHLVRTCGARTA
jgi:hypothetical protein